MAAPDVGRTRRVSSRGRHRCLRLSRIPRPQQGFTLIELLVVITVIGVLATLVAPNVFRHLGAAKETTARSQIEMLGAALDAYRLDTGRYPTTEQGLAALWTAPSGDPRPISWRGPYLRKDVPADPWNRPYIYRSPAQTSRGGYDLLSLGEDGKPGGDGNAADITSWQ
jgi:general secretion pathway protein G